ncbi:MAG: efflux RND transporter permease subunit, partial [Deltaproteobacteria bacterium]|nr:efflux RND transporter permease subunit [Deltaproteobacteria bacterium]
MALIRFFLEKPALVGAIAVFLIIAGLTSLFRIPIQLTPDVQTPMLTVQTLWPGASPYEVEKEIVIKQENALRRLPGLERISCESSSGQGRIILEFAIGTDLNDAILRISNELDQVSSYPENAMRPRVITSGSNSSPVMWMQLRAIDGNPIPIDQYQQFAEDEIVAEFEKIRGVSEARVYGGRAKEAQIKLDTEKLASFKISLSQIISQIRKENVDISGGSIDEGKRKYIIRTLSKYRGINDLGNLIIKKFNGQKLYLRDLAEIKIGHKESSAKVLQNGQPSMVIPLYQEQGANILEVTDKAIELIQQLNQVKLKPRGIELRRLSDQRYYIESAISLVSGNLFLGSFLAFGVLLLFLGSIRSALVIVVSIPISVLSTFICLQVFGRNINVISLAGLAFSVGMVVDSAIV